MWCGCVFALCGGFVLGGAFVIARRACGAFFVCCGGVFVVVVFSAPAQCSCRP